MLIDAIRELSGNSGTPVGSISLKSKLNWDDSKYKRVRKPLVEKGTLVTGTGRGGSIRLVDAANNEKLKMFVSYSHVDSDGKTRLMNHLEPLKQLGIISSWDDREIKAGDKWENEITKNLEEADIILLLISIDFINSKYCHDIEMTRALEMQEDGNATVIPIIYRNCLWKHSRFSSLQALPDGGKPVHNWQNIDDALTNVAEGIMKTAKSLSDD